MNVFFWYWLTRVVVDKGPLDRLRLLFAAFRDYSLAVEQKFICKAIKIVILALAWFSVTVCPVIKFFM